MQKHLIIFAREPRYGCVKSRLARDIGKGNALQFYRAQLHKLIRNLGANPKWQTWVMTTPDMSAAFMQNQFANTFVIPQGNGDLGARMARFLGDVLPPGPALLIGSDIPAITHQHINQGFNLLGHHDACFGPAKDGGYWMVGLKRLRKQPVGFLENVRWSHLKTLQDSVETLPSVFKVGFADELEDVDDGDAYKSWRGSCR